MIVIPDKKNAVYFDVDDTLVLHDRHDLPDEDVLLIDVGDMVFSVHPHTKHIERLKEHKQSGDTVVVWSQGGSEWAEIVVNVLGLTEYVDVCLTKPHFYYDDLMAFQFMGNPTYIKPEA